MNVTNVCFDCAFPQPFLISGLCEDCHRLFFDHYAKVILQICGYKITLAYTLEGWSHEHTVNRIEWNYSSNHKAFHDSAYTKYLEWDKNKAKKQ